MGFRLSHLFSSLLKSLRDISPIVVVILFFQLFVLDSPLPNVLSILSGTAMVVVGLTFFVMGLELGLFPIGENLAHAFANKGSLSALLAFAFCLGFGTTIAEPALVAVAKEAAEVAAQALHIENSEASMSEYAAGLRLSVAFAVGFAIVIGVVRIIKGWPLYQIIIGGYLLIVVLTLFAPQEIIGIAYDSGGVTTSTITVPLVTALGVGLAASIKGRNPLLDGFGLIALASLTPIMFVMLYGIIY
ncbi:DUF1538 family protein [Agarivorans sp. MS3-6]|uniref:DUF1538 domain-containing protein n=1 Tax=Agarivorans sp. TSD2052 TaxID=2937286 RepID=UPI00200DF76B|nr:DUF1538 domain-containing protein [Agarivorans sp. TSD2052]UPW19866.1 DUF1538 domain-containing protein [Agarivorans sp. TSD2052]